MGHGFRIRAAAAAEQLQRQPTAQFRLAPSGITRHQNRVTEAPVVDGNRQFGFHRRLPGQFHQPGGSRLQQGRQRPFDVAPDEVQGTCGIDHGNPRGGFRARQVVRPDPLEEGAPFPLEAVSAPLRDAHGNRIERSIEVQGQVGLQMPMHQFFQCGDGIGVHAPAAALIGIGRIREALADHPAPGIQRRLDGSRQVLASSREYQKHLREVGNGLVAHP